MSFLDQIIDEKTAFHHVMQGTVEWEQLRVGRFTSSEWYKLMDCGKREMTAEELKARPKSGKGSKTKYVPDPSQMSEKGIKYVYQKVWETLTGQQVEQSYAYPLVYGKEMEPVAVQYFEEKYGVETEVVGFHKFTDHAGGSPDRFVGDDEGLEIKCPSSEAQINYLMLTDHYDLKNNYPDHYWQCVSLMLFTDRKRWNFCTFDPRMKDEKHKMSHLVIEWDKVDEDIDACAKALEGAVKLKLEIIQSLQ
jgi:hypothetical protein